MKRSGKFYRKNEAEVMKELGFKPTVNSGSGWIEKEDGQNEKMICQLKSTDANSIKVNKKDLDTLMYNANVSHKLPVFAIQFLQSNETYLIVKPDTLQDISKYLDTGVVESSVSLLELEEVEEVEDVETEVKTVVRSATSARERFREERESKYKKKERSAT